VPQNRERVFIISIRKDLDNSQFKFPQIFDNGVRLKDVLEDIVDERYYISQEKTDKLIEQLKNKRINCDNNEMIKIGNIYSSKGQNGNIYNTNGISPTISSGVTSTQGNGGIGSNNAPKILQIGMLDIKGNEQVRRVYDPEGLSPTLNSMQGGNRQPKIIEDFYSNRNIREYEDYSPTLRADRQGLKVIQGCSTRTRNYIGQPEQLEIRNDELSNSITTVQKDSMCFINKSPNPELVGGIGEINFGKQYRQGNRVYSSEKTAMALMSQPVDNTGGNSYLYYKDCRIRKLTPLECFRLMGFDDQDYYILKENGISNSQIYKMAGNSIVVDVLYYILLELYKAMPYLLEDIKLSSFFSGIGAFEKAILRLREIINKEQFKDNVINY